MSRGARHSLLLQRVLETADSVLDLACDLVGLAVGLQLGIAYTLPMVSLTEPLISFAVPAIRTLSMTEADPVCATAGAAS